MSKLSARLNTLAKQAKGRIEDKKERDLKARWQELEAKSPGKFYIVGDEIVTRAEWMKSWSPDRRRIYKDAMKQLREIRKEAAWEGRGTP